MRKQTFTATEVARRMGFDHWDQIRVNGQRIGDCGCWKELLVHGEEQVDEELEFIDYESSESLIE